MKKMRRMAGIVLAGVVILGTSGRLGAQAPAAAEGMPPWYVSLGGGYIKYEGDEATKGGGDILLRLSYDYTPAWTFRGEVSYFPELKANVVYNYETGVPVPRPGLDGDSTWAAGVAGDVLFHIIALDNRRWDPYLIGGFGLLHYEKNRAWRAQTDMTLRYGIGLAYHFTPAWSIYGDMMGLMTIDKTEFNWIPNAGVSWKWGAHVPKKFVVAGSADLAAAPAPPTPPPADDLRMFKLDIMFTEGHWHPEYISELDAIAKVVQTYPDSEILIEGHLDQQPNMSEQDARKWTQKRAEAVRDYLVDNHASAKKRITAVGCGFSRPQAPNDPVRGNPENRRLEIHIRPPPTNQ